MSVGVQWRQHQVVLEFARCWWKPWLQAGILVVRLDHVALVDEVDVLRELGEICGEGVEK